MERWTKGAPGSRDLWRGFGDAWTAVGYLISGIATWGGVGYGLDRLLHTTPVLFVIGALMGNVGGIYLMYIRTMPPDRPGEGRR